MRSRLSSPAQNHQKVVIPYNCPHGTHSISHPPSLSPAKWRNLSGESSVCSCVKHPASPPHHTHTHTHAHTDGHTHTHVHTDAHTHTHTHILTLTHILSLTHTRTHLVRSYRVVPALLLLQAVIVSSNIHNNFITSFMIHS